MKKKNETNTNTEITEDVISERVEAALTER